MDDERLLLMKILNTSYGQNSYYSPQKNLKTVPQSQILTNSHDSVSFGAHKKNNNMFGDFFAWIAEVNMRRRQRAFEKNARETAEYYEKHGELPDLLSPDDLPPSDITGMAT